MDMPKTADGVEIVEGMTLWLQSDEDDDHEPREVTVYLLDGSWFSAGNDFCTVSGDVSEWSEWMWSSARPARLAALTAAHARAVAEVARLEGEIAGEGGG